MRVIGTMLTVAVAALLASSALADEGSEKKGDRPSREEMRQKMIEKFDKDGLGDVSDAIAPTRILHHLRRADGCGSCGS
jgi:hypothetical protein